MIALVFEVIAFSISSGNMVHVIGSISTITGVAFAYRTAFMVAANVKSGTITSSPGPIPNATSAR